MKILQRLIILLGTITTLFVGANIVSALGAGSISGTIFLDSTCNGYDLSDEPLSNIPATLISKDPKLSIKLKSDVQGNVLFTNLPYGKYSLAITPGKKYSPQNSISLYEIGEANATVSGIFVFCNK